MLLNVPGAEVLAAGVEHRGCARILVSRETLNPDSVGACSRFSDVGDGHAVDAIGLLVAHQEGHVIRSAGTIGWIAAWSDDPNDLAVDVQPRSVIDTIEVTVGGAWLAPSEVEPEAPLVTVQGDELSAACVLGCCSRPTAHPAGAGVRDRAGIVVITNRSIRFKLIRGTTTTGAGAVFRHIALTRIGAADDRRGLELVNATVR